jgi:hypothetical protein
MTKEEKANLLKKVNAPLANYGLKIKRQILWEILQESITEDSEGIKWLYFQLEKFINSEFSG